MEEAVKRAGRTLAGGLGFIKPDQTVLIKPNVTGDSPDPTTTSPEVLYAVIKLVAAQGQSGSSWPTASSHRSVQYDHAQDDRRDEERRPARRGQRSDHRRQRRRSWPSASRMPRPKSRISGKPANTEHSAQGHAPAGHELAQRLRTGRAAVRRRSRHQRAGDQDAFPGLVHDVDEGLRRHEPSPQPSRIPQAFKGDEQSGRPEAREPASGVARGTQARRRRRSSRW